MTDEGLSSQLTHNKPFCTWVVACGDAAEIHTMRDLKIPVVFWKSKAKKWPSTPSLTLWLGIALLWIGCIFSFFGETLSWSGLWSAVYFLFFFPPPIPSLIVRPALIALTCSMLTPCVPSLLGLPVLYSFLDHSCGYSTLGLFVRSDSLRLLMEALFSPETHSVPD